MNFWDLLTYAAWIVSGGLLLYIVVDTVLVSTRYSEEFLLSSREGEDRLLSGDADSAEDVQGVEGARGARGARGADHE